MCEELTAEVVQLIAISRSGSSPGAAVDQTKEPRAIVKASSSTVHIEGLAPLFLKNAIRSHLHFSQLNSWISTQNGDLPDGISCTYRIRHDVGEFSAAHVVMEHTFPMCRIDRQSCLVVSVKYVKSEQMPLPVGLCLTLGALPTDQWLLPSPVGSPTDDCPLMASTPQATAITSLKHKPLPPLSPPPSSDGPSPKFSAVAGPNDEVSSLSASDIVLPESRLARHQPGSLLGNFEESALNGRLDPVKRLDGFKLQLAATGAFSSPHTSLSVTAYFFDLNDSETAPSPYLGTCSLDSLGKRGYRVPKQGTIQATLFNPQGTVVKVFVVVYDMSDMPPSSQTFIRQRTFLGTVENSKADKHLLNLIHFRLATDRRCRLYLHTDVRMLFSQNNTLDALNLELKDQVGHESDRYRLIVETELPRHPRYSPKK
ncbi:unnamed protein product [Nippostrongylus brasiliensis]|uniref:DUF4210 domain-containing protein n=1 Tax=Nippostrongylus brasiliensis TaxID=27835 RepID=A0A0N4XYQ4_NIPBR|nr:unnamed protein product [Nippostrongylus brasiliensis]